MYPTTPMKPTVKCKWCGEPTMMNMTRECDACWHLHKLIEEKPEIAIKMLVKAKVSVTKKMEESEQDTLFLMALEDKQ
jgi:hypothetical protein